MLSATSIANYIDCKVHFHELAATYAMWKSNGLDLYARVWMWRLMELASCMRPYPGTDHSSIRTFQCIPPPSRVTRGAMRHDYASKVSEL